MQAAQQQGSVSQELAHKTDGVLLAVGGLSSILKKKVKLLLQLAVRQACYTCCMLFPRHQWLASVMPLT